jgi:hypothetical protein
LNGLASDEIGWCAMAHVDEAVDAVVEMEMVDEGVEVGR